jgi:hypothetical protein
VVFFTGVSYVLEVNCFHGGRVEACHNSGGGPTFAFTLRIGDDGP